VGSASAPHFWRRFSAFAAPLAFGSHSVGPIQRYWDNGNDGFPNSTQTFYAYGSHWPDLAITRLSGAGNEWSNDTLDDSRVSLGVNGEPVISTVDDPYAAAVLRIIELGGTPCIREIHVEPDIQSYDLDRNAGRLSGPEGMLPGGKAFVGSLAAAAKGFNAEEILTGSKEGRSVVIAQARDVPDIADAAPIGYVLIPVPLKDGRTAWLRAGDYVASIPCAPENS
jgi:hypothetical protein